MKHGRGFLCFLGTVPASAVGAGLRGSVQPHAGFDFRGTENDAIDNPFVSTDGFFLNKKPLLPESQNAPQTDSGPHRHFHPVIERETAELAQPGDGIRALLPPGDQSVVPRGP